MQALKVAMTNFTKGADMVGDVIKNGEEKLAQKVTTGYTKAKTAIAKSFRAAKEKSLNEMNLIGKDQAREVRPATRSQHRVPSAFEHFRTWFESWNSPGTLCAAGLFITLMSLFFTTSFRCCMRARSYEQVFQRASSHCQSRDIELARSSENAEETVSVGSSRVSLLPAPAETESEVER